SSTPARRKVHCTTGAASAPNISLRRTRSRRANTPELMDSRPDGIGTLTTGVTASLVGGRLGVHLGGVTILRGALADTAASLSLAAMDITSEGDSMVAALTGLMVDFMAAVGMAADFMAALATGKRHTGLFPHDTKSRPQKSRAQKSRLLGRDFFAHRKLSQVAADALIDCVLGNVSDNLVGDLAVFEKQ